MGYTEKKEKQIELDRARGTAHTIEGAMAAKRAAIENPKPTKSIPISMPAPTSHFPSSTVGTIGNSGPVIGSSVVGTTLRKVKVPQGPGIVDEFIDKNYPKKVPLWAYIAMSVVGCIIGAAVGSASGNAIIGAIVGTALGFFCIPIVAIGFQLVLRILALAAVILIGYFILTHLAH